MAAFERLYATGLSPAGLSHLYLSADGSAELQLVSGQVEPTSQNGAKVLPETRYRVEVPRASLEALEHLVASSEGTAAERPGVRSGGRAGPPNEPGLGVHLAWSTPAGERRSLDFGDAPGELLEAAWSAVEALLESAGLGDGSAKAGPEPIYQGPFDPVYAAEGFEDLRPIPRLETVALEPVRVEGAARSRYLDREGNLYLRVVEPQSGDTGERRYYQQGHGATFRAIEALVAHPERLRSGTEIAPGDSLIGLELRWSDGSAYAEASGSGMSDTFAMVVELLEGPSLGETPIYEGPERVWRPPTFPPVVKVRPPPKSPAQRMVAAVKRWWKRRRR